MGYIPRIVVLNDNTDFDNPAQLAGVAALFPKTEIFFVLTGRPTYPNPVKGESRFDLEFSEQVQFINAARMHAFVSRMGFGNVRIYNGGIARASLVPEHVHLKEWEKFDDIPGVYKFDDKVALGKKVLLPLSDFADMLISGPDFPLLAGGPLTGYKELFGANRALQAKIIKAYAMPGSLGTVKLMDFGGIRNQKQQFNAHGDTEATYQFAVGSGFPKYLITSDSTRNPAVGFNTNDDFREFLPRSERANIITELSQVWYDNAVLPRIKPGGSPEMLWVHDFALTAKLYCDSIGEPDLIYTPTPIRIVDVPHRPGEEARFGEMDIEFDSLSEHKVAVGYAPGGVEQYLGLLHQAFV